TVHNIIKWVLGAHGVRRMLRFKVGSDYQGTLRVLHDSIGEINGRLEYYSPPKGVIIFSKP
ncbi:MAG: hypothetical protein KAQ96_02795, partial [Thermoplasmata archaeon]|nr:hypothetical protein [Thermoplasmata archaeon]